MDSKPMTFRVPRVRAMMLELPFPPSINHYWRNVKGRTLISREGRAYRKHVEALLLSTSALQGRLRVTIRAFMPDKRRRDLDNILKSLLDALEHGGAIEDDGDIDRLVIERAGIDKANPRVKVKIEPTPNGKADDD